MDTSRVKKFRLTSKQRKRTHLVLLVIFTLLLYPSLIWWKESILWVVFMSHFTILVNHAIGYAEEENN